LDIRTLRYFVVAAETQNLSRACERLNVVQSALSHQITGLEAKLGGQLFDRIGRRIRLSEAGKVFLEDARAILKAVESAKLRALKAANGTLGELHVSFENNSSRSILVSEVLLAFRKGFPEVTVQLAPMPAGEIPEAIRSGAIDLGFIYTTEPIDDLNSLVLQSAEWLLVMPRHHPLASKKNILLRDLSDERFIWHTVSPAIYESIMATFHANGMLPNLIEETQHEIMMVNLLSSGVGVGFVVDATSRRWPNDVVVVRRIDDFSLPLRLSLVWRQDSESTILPHLISIATDLAAKG
jgi:DNA-binding transcriptional LysR family regulator